MIDSKSILNLVTAGYTKSEIIQMFGEQTPQSQQQTPQTTQPQQQTPQTTQPQQQTPQTTQPQQQTPQTPSEQATTNDLMLAIKALTEAVQLSNRNNAQQPNETKLTGDSVMSTFIK